MVNVAIFDYGAGNIFSLKTSLEKNGATVDVRSGYKVTPVPINDSLESVQEFLFSPQSSSSTGKKESIEKESSYDKMRFG